MNKKRLGFLSYWGVWSGLANTTLTYCKMIQDEYDIYILKQGLNPIEESFKEVNVHITEYPNYIVDSEVFKTWITENKLDAVFFDEYSQWNSEPVNLVKVAKDLGVKVYGILVDEKFKPEQTQYYDRILVRTRTGERLMRKFKIRNFTYVPQSIDMKEFELTKPIIANDKFTFLHVGGRLGVKNRKGTDKVLEAFIKLNNPNTKLIITCQRDIKIDNLPENVELITRDLSRKELIELYRNCDATVFPSRWETIGIGIQESLAAGVPVITTDYPPMNEFIQNGKNGFLVKADLTWDRDITVPVMECDTNSIRINMENIMNDFVYQSIQKNCRKTILDNYDISKTKSYLLDFLRDDLK